MRITGCREQANGSRQIIRASTQHAKTDPAAFAAIVRVNRVQERKLRAQQAAALERALLAVRQDLEALMSASPPSMGMEVFSGRLESLEQGVRSLSGMVPSDGTGPQMVETIQRAARAFRAARDRWSQGEGQAEEVARLEHEIKETRQKLASRESFVARAELDAHEHNLKQQKGHLSRSTRQSEAAWRDAVPAGKAAFASLGR
ncbi:MAG: hypothetical protein HYV93_10380 [Candidatus Rokubacteria bacterium]|nr:hypothetical protein [Candidatus Rokubacteria bacterium]